MEQPILTTKTRQFVLSLTTFLRERHSSQSGVGKAFRVTDAQCQILLVVVDVLLLLAGGLAAWWLAQSGANGQLGVSRLGMAIPNWSWVGILLSVWLLFEWLTDLYDVRFTHARWLSAARIILVHFLSVLVVVLFAFFFEITYPRTFLLFYLGIGILLVIAWRFTYAALSRTSIFVRKVLILGTGPSAQMIANLLKQEQGLRYEVSGYISVMPDTRTDLGDGLPVLAATSSLFDLGRNFNVDTIVAAIEGETDPTLLTELIACQTYGINILSVPALYHRLCQKVPVDYVHSTWLMEAIQSSSSGMRRLCTRTMDLTVTLFTLPWFLLVFPLIALAIKLNSPGPILYRQVRSGLGGRPFHILKFRTMYTDAEKDGKARWAKKNDPRITEVGRFLRKARLDELPQFINILRGDMSLIGPRPERPEFVAQLEKELPYYGVRLLVPPGLTGWAQIKYTYGSSVEDARIKLEYDVYYVRYWSVWMDIYILFQTVSVVLRAKGT